MKIMRLKNTRKLQIQESITTKAEVKLRKNNDEKYMKKKQLGEEVKKKQKMRKKYLGEK